MPQPVKFKRKLFRLVGFLFPALYLGLGEYGRWATIGVLLLFIATMFTLEVYRFRYPGVNRWLFEHFKSFTKEKERARVSTTTLFLVASLLTVVLFPRGIAIAAILFLVVGDPVAEIVGLRYGRVPLLGKSLEGTLAGLCACLLMAALARALPLGLGWPALLAGAVAATVAELLPIPVDDNFTIPLAAGLAMALVSGWHGWPVA